MSSGCSVKLGIIFTKFVHKRGKQSFSSGQKALLAFFRQESYNYKNKPFAYYRQICGNFASNI
jgi:hypothetical protein